MKMSKAIQINPNKCIGCKRCSAICIRDSIDIVDKKAVYNGKDCFLCYQCYSICPRNAISLTDFPEFEVEPIADGHVAYDDFMKLLKDRRSIRWFTDEKITRGEFKRLFAVGGYTPTGMNCQDVEFVVLDERLDDFMKIIYKILKPHEYELPRIHQFCEYMEGEYENPKGHPFLWEGRQLVLSFSRIPIDAVLAAVRMELAGYTIGLGGFYSHFIIIAAEMDPSKITEFFSEISAEKRLHCAYVVGHPRVKYERDVPPRQMKTYFM